MSRATDELPQRAIEAIYAVMRFLAGSCYNPVLTFTFLPFSAYCKLEN